VPEPLCTTVQLINSDNQTIYFSFATSNDGINYNAPSNDQLAVGGTRNEPYVGGMFYQFNFYRDAAMTNLIGTTVLSNSNTAVMDICSISVKSTGSFPAPLAQVVEAFPKVRNPINLMYTFTSFPQDWDLSNPSGQFVQFFWNPDYPDIWPLNFSLTIPNNLYAQLYFYHDDVTNFANQIGRIKIYNTSPQLIKYSNVRISD
jgi:hypothetical protein